MVHIRDEGSEFDASIEEIWKFLGSPQVHTPAHVSRRNSQVKPIGENAILLSVEQNMGGHWQKVLNRVTLLPPIGMAVEMLDGPLAGSKFFTYYTPKGGKTGVTVVGEFVSKSIPPAQLESEVLRSLEETFNEDNLALRKLASKA